MTFGGWICEILKQLKTDFVDSHNQSQSFYFNIYLMKFLKRFNEADEHQMSWAGSLYANKNPMVVKYPETFPIPQKETELYKCNKCGIERRYFNDEKLQCKRCNSEDLEKEIDSLE